MVSAVLELLALVVSRQAPKCLMVLLSDTLPVTTILPNLRHGLNCRVVTSILMCIQVAPFMAKSAQTESAWRAQETSVSQISDYVRSLLGIAAQTIMVTTVYLV